MIPMLRILFPTSSGKFPSLCSRIKILYCIFKILFYNCITLQYNFSIAYLKLFLLDILLCSLNQILSLIDADANGGTLRHSPSKRSKSVSAEMREQKVLL